MTSEAMQGWYDSCNAAMDKFWDDWFNDFTQQKEKQMDKQEAAKELEVLRKKIKEIEEGLLKGDGPWRADVDKEYWFVVSDGGIAKGFEEDDHIDISQYNVGNYFQTEEDAKASLIYKVLNDKYHYWVAGVTEFPDSIPDGCEVLDSISRLWKAEANNCPTQWNNSPRRWLKH